MQLNQICWAKNSHGLLNTLGIDNYHWNQLNLMIQLYSEFRLRYIKFIKYEIINSLIRRYLHRFDEEVEQIEIKQSIGKHRIHQHFSRLNAIKITIEKETAEYNGGGFGKETTMLNIYNIYYIKILNYLQNLLICVIPKNLNILCLGTEMH